MHREKGGGREKEKEVTRARNSHKGQARLDAGGERGRYSEQRVALFFLPLSLPLRRR